MTIPAIAVAICLVGVVLSWRLAAAYLRRNPTLFTVMALFAFIWGLLADYWHSKQTSTPPSSVVEHIGVYTSFLNLNIGGLLVSYAHEISGSSKSRAVSFWQVLSLPLLFVVFADHGFTIPILDIPLNSEQVALSVDVGLGIVGFYVVAAGIWALCGATTSILLIIVFFFYTIVALASTLTKFSLPESFGIARDLIASINDHFDLAVTILKVPYILIFALAITYIGMKPRYRKTCIWTYIGWFVKIPQQLAPDKQQLVPPRVG